MAAGGNARAMADAVRGEPSVDSDDWGQPSLSRGERSGAAAAGVALLVAGCIATFRVENQAGTAVLLLSGVAFLVMGIQGTPLIRIGGENTSIEMERRYRRARRIVERIAEEDGPEAAHQAAEVLEDVDPHLRLGHAADNAMTYERAVYDHLCNVLDGTSVTITTGAVFGPAEVDILVETPEDRLLIDVKYSSRQLLSASVVHEVVGKFVRGIPGKIILISNVPLTVSGIEWMKNAGQDVVFVQWRGGEDNQSLIDALRKLGVLKPS